MAPSWPRVKSRVKFLHLPVKSYHQPLNLGRYLGRYRRQPLPWALPRALLRALPRALPRAPLLRQHSLPRMCNYRNLGRHLGRYLRRPLLWSLPRARRPQMHPVIHVLCGRRRAHIQFLKLVLKALLLTRQKMRCSSLGTPSEAGLLAPCEQPERLMGCSSPCCAGVQNHLSLPMGASASKLLVPVDYIGPCHRLAPSCLEQPEQCPLLSSWRGNYVLRCPSSGVCLPHNLRDSLTMDSATGWTNVCRWIDTRRRPPVNRWRRWLLASRGGGFLYGHTLWLDALRIQRPLVHFPAA